MEARTKGPQLPHRGWEGSKDFLPVPENKNWLSYTACEMTSLLKGTRWLFCSFLLVDRDAEQDLQVLCMRRPPWKLANNLAMQG